MVLAACSASAREKTIRTTLAATDSARMAFVAYDEKHQLAIVADAKDRASGEAELAKWRAKQATIEGLFALAYRAVAAAATVNDDPSVSSMIAAALLLSQGLHDAGVTP